MRRILLKVLEKRYLPRWIVILNDIAVISSMFVLAYILRYNLEAKYVKLDNMLFQMLAGLPFLILGFLLFKPYQGIIRHSTLYDAVKIIKAQLVLTSGFIIITIWARNYNLNFVIPWSVIIVHFFVSVFTLSFIRFLIQYIYSNILNVPFERTAVMIYGAGEMGSKARNVIENDAKLNYKIVGFIDDNQQLWEHSIGGTEVFSLEAAFSKIIPKKKVKEIILAIPNISISVERKREIAERCISSYIKIKEVPDPSSWLNGQLYSDQIQNINIEDLLGREPIKMNLDMVYQGIKGKTVMVTGGAGSIGSEIVRQLIYLQPESIIIVDQAESPLYNIQQEILMLSHEIKVEVFVANVTDSFRMHEIFDSCRPHIIYHAAAYKHVPLMEHQPDTAIKNNIGGTKTIADLAKEFKVEKFVMVSTDKAVNPTNVMGATKRICELYIQSLSQQANIKTQFITTRFGNVLGSEGSVIPLFKKQISRGGPVSITHKEIIRYFMTIPEACQLVLEAGFMGKGGEIFLFEMGEPVKIYDLAEKMISLSGLIPHKEIKIEVTGLRPGEKLFEELLTTKEDSIPTNNKKIMISRIKPYDHKNVLAEINDLLKSATSQDDVELVVKLKKIIPEYVSQNSEFEVLDSK